MAQVLYVMYIAHSGSHGDHPPYIELITLWLRCIHMHDASMIPYRTAVEQVPCIMQPITQLEHVK